MKASTLSLLLKWPLIALLAVSALALADPQPVPADTAGTAPEPLAITVYKSPSCGCCGDWAIHLEQHGFQVTPVNLADLSSVKTRLGVPQQLRSCHTAVIGDFVIEGHVPAEDIKTLVAQRNGYGLAVPGMPVGSPGMEMGDRKDAFDVIAFDRDGGTSKVKEYRDY